MDCAGVPKGTSKYDACDVCGGNGSTCCGANGKACCVNYSAVPDAYWDFLLLPVTLNDIIDKLRFTHEIFDFLNRALPPYDVIQTKIRELNIGRMAEFNRLFIEECLEEFCEKSGTIYSQVRSTINMIFEFDAAALCC